MKKSPTVFDVAALAGVGSSTVSRYLRGVRIKPEAALRVENAIRRTGYQLDGSAQALRLGRTHNLGVVVPKVSNAFFSQAVQFMGERARVLGYSLLLFTHEDRADDQRRQLETLRKCRVDGVLLTAAPGTSAEEVTQALGKTPVVAFDACVTADFHTVVLQNRQAAADGVAHLAAHGYQRIAVVSAKPEVFSFSERIAGYTESMRDRCLAPQDLLAADYEQLRQVLRRVMSGPMRPEAILSLSDFATRNVVQVFEELRLPPESWIPLLGFDDFDYAPLLKLPITVIRQPIEEMVRTAVNLLVGQIEGRTALPSPTLVEIPGELIRRRSCGCA